MRSTNNEKFGKSVHLFIFSTIFIDTVNGLKFLLNVNNWSSSMKYLLIAVLTTSLVFSSAPAKADDLKRLVSSLCDYAQHNSRSSMRKKLKQARIKLRQIYASVRCKPADGFEGGSLLRVSTFFGSFESAKFIVSQIGKKGVGASEKDGKNITAWTENLKGSSYSGSADLGQFIELYKSKG